MPSQISDREYGQAILESVRSGSYPETEDIVSAHLPTSALPTLLKLVAQAREDVKRNIRQISKDSASDIDGWIAQAKQLREDIEHTRNFSQEIVTQAEHGEQLSAQVNDALSKVDLLKGEVVFNERLATTLGDIRGLRQTLSVAENAIQNEGFSDAVNRFKKAETEILNLQGSQVSKVSGLFQAKIEHLRYNIVGGLTECWRNLLCVDSARSIITIKDQIQRRTTSVKIDTVVHALSRLGLLEEKISAFCKDIDNIILMPRLKSKAGGAVYEVHIEDSMIQISREIADLSIGKLFSDMNSILSFLHDRLPSSVSIPLTAQLMPNLTHRLISNWLSFEVPIDVEGIQPFKSVLALVAQFARTLDSFSWPGKDILMTWVDEIPEVWLKKRREISLDRIRRLLIGGLGSIETVERVETQKLSRQDGVFAGNGRDDDWNAEWSDEEGSKPDAGESPDVKNDRPEDEEEEGVSAWGLDEDPEEDTVKNDPERSDLGNEGAEAWGWGDDNDEGEASKSTEASPTTSKKTKANSLPKVPQPSAREVTLKETYNITSLPREILKIITQIISDAETLRRPEYMDSPIASAAGGLFSLPGLVLSMYRASAPSYYTANPSGNMFLYNDSLWLAESLRQFTGTQIRRSGQINGGAAESEISALESYAKRTYGKEMESQRTIIGDLLDGAQGFASCTEAPFSEECDIAVGSTVDRLRDVHKQWKPVLSHSALLQSLGSLLSTVVNKILFDVEDMSDISEPESQRLTAFCNQIAALEDLFTPQQSENMTVGKAGAMPLTAVYTPNWLKFQYLANILESSLVDIKYLWTEGELRLEFEAEELIDLIEALFADSEHRRKAIGDIRRVSIRR